MASPRKRVRQEDLILDQTEDPTFSGSDSDVEVLVGKFPGNLEEDPSASATNLLQTELPISGGGKITWVIGVIDGKPRAVCSRCNAKVHIPSDIVAGNLETRVGRGYKGVFARDDIGARNRHNQGHLDEDKQSETAAATTAKARRLIQTTLDKKLDRRDVACLLATHRLAFNAASDPLMQKFIKAATGETTVSRQSAQLWTKTTATELRLRLIDRLKQGDTITTAALAIDGGTINRQVFLNFTIAKNSEVFFWRTVVMKQLTALAIGDAVEAQIAELSNKGIIIIAVVSDNATAMVRAIDDLRYDNVFDKDTDGEDIPLAEVLGNADRVAQAIPDFPKSSRFCLHIRCWAHSLQLIFGDSQKHCAVIRAAFETVTKVVPLLQQRENRTRFREHLAAEGKKFRTLFTPAVTRWNSYIKAMWRLLECQTSLNAVIPNLVSNEDLFNMQVTVIALLPICWATESVEKDDCTVLTARVELALQESNLDYVLALPFKTREVEQAVHGAVEAVKKSLKARRAKNFTTDLTRLVDWLDPGTASIVLKEDGTELVWEEVQEEIEKYWSDRGVVEDIKDRIQATLAKFAVLGADERREDIRTFWTRRQPNWPHVGGFALALLDLLASEASVERSFMLQTLLVSPQRTQLNEESMNDQLFLLANRRLRDSVAAKKQTTRISIADKIQWRSLSQDLQPPCRDPAMRTRMAAKQDLARCLKPGQRIQVLWALPTGEDFKPKLALFVAYSSIP
jgi:hypothetical protein